VTCSGSGSASGSGSGSTDNQNTEPVAQGATKSELAETGAGETMFLLIGAATMIAGGVGFRLMPRLMTRRTVA
jgi:LPXTG-motif cell wall-anchored protein